MVALKRADSAFKISDNDGGRAPQASWLSKTRGGLTIRSSVALKRADSAFKISGNDGGRAPEAV